MRLLRRTAVLLLLVVVGPRLLAPPAVRACTCLPPGAAAAPEPGRVVFEGTAMGLRGLDPGQPLPQDRGPPRRAVWTFAVERVLVGTVGGPPEVVTGLGSGECGAAFTFGGRYLVVASRLPPGAPADIAGRLVTSICAGNLPLQPGPPEPPAPPDPPDPLPAPEPPGPAAPPDPLPAPEPAPAPEPMGAPDAEASPATGEP